MRWGELSEVDARLSQRLRLDDKRDHLLRIFAVFFAHSGDSWFWLVGLGLLWLFTRGEWRRIAMSMTGGIVFLAAVVLLIKFTVRRRRPDGEWGAIYRNTDPHSFPSGHAARSLMLAVVALGVGPLWFGLLLLVWAPLVSLARVAMGVHYLLDILAGVFIGVVAGLCVLGLTPFAAQLFPFLF